MNCSGFQKEYSHEVIFQKIILQKVIFCILPRDWLASPVSDVNYGKHFAAIESLRPLWLQSVLSSELGGRESLVKCFRTKDRRQKSTVKVLFVQLKFSQQHSRVEARFHRIQLPGLKLKKRAVSNKQQLKHCAAMEKTFEAGASQLLLEVKPHLLM